MKLKNIGTTVVSVGKTVILPDETADIKDKAYENNAAVNYLVKTNRLVFVKEEEKKQRKISSKQDKKPEHSEASAEDSKQEEFKQETAEKE